MWMDELFEIMANLRDWVLPPILGLILLEVVWNLTGAYGLSANILWLIKFCLIGYAGYVCTEGGNG